MQVKHAVITSVSRDELKDRGRRSEYQTVVQCKQVAPTTTFGNLDSRHQGKLGCTLSYDRGKQEVVSHNMETVSACTAGCVQTKYERSLEQLEANPRSWHADEESGIMLGVGETKEEVFKAMDDLVAHGLMILTLRQYLQPTKMHLEVAGTSILMYSTCTGKKA